MTTGQRVAVRFAEVVGSWRFIGTQSLFLCAWIVWNVYAPPHWRFDPEPFILLNLMLSFQAAYTGPVLLMAANVQEARNRATAEADLAADEETNRLVHEILARLPE